MFSFCNFSCLNEEKKKKKKSSTGTKGTVSFMLAQCSSSSDVPHLYHWANNLRQAPFYFTLTSDGS